MYLIVMLIFGKILHMDIDGVIHTIPLLRRGKPIVQFNNNMQIINIFNNMNIAINETSESRSTITSSSNKNRLTKRGYYWKFASDISSDNLNFINKDIKEKYYEMTA